MKKKVKICLEKSMYQYPVYGRDYFEMFRLEGEGF